jgi:hypothetical protein
LSYLEDLQYQIKIFTLKKQESQSCQEKDTKGVIRSHVLSVFSSPCQRQCELLPSLAVRRPLTFHILIFSSKITQPNELKLGRNHLWKALYKYCTYLKQELPVAAMFING